MSFIGKNIKKIRTLKKMSQTVFADLFHLTRANIGSYEEGRAEPKMEVIISIANYFSISLEAFLTKEITVNEIVNFDIFKNNLEPAVGALTLKKSHQNGDIPFISSKAIDQAEYIRNLRNSVQTSGLPSFKVLEGDNNSKRAFAYRGSEMNCNGIGLNDGDVLICSLILPANRLNIKPNNIYVVVTNDDIIIRRISDCSKAFILVADNPAYKSYSIPHDSVLELWEVQGIYSTYLLSK